MKLLAAIYKDGSQFLFHRALNCVKTVANAPTKPVYWEMMLTKATSDSATLSLFYTVISLANNNYIKILKCIQCAGHD